MYETITNYNKIEELKYALGFDNCFAPDRESRGGGIAFLWHKTKSCTISNYSRNHIDVEVDDLRHGKWRLTGFYGFPEGSRRKDSWNLIRQLSNLSNLPWCIIGDFNDILTTTEKKGRTDRAPWLIHGFRDVIQDAGLTDIYMEGYNFTWFKSLGTDRAMEEKHDKDLANDSWFNLFQRPTLNASLLPRLIIIH